MIDIDKVHRFIENRITDIEKNTKDSWESIYNEIQKDTFFQGEWWDQFTGAFTSIMLKVGLDPAEELGYVPAGYLKDVTDIDSYVVPEGVRSIRKKAFNGTHLTSVILPSTLESIGEFAFSFSSRLKEITIPLSVKYIGRRCFLDTRNLRTIYCEAASQPDGWASNYPYAWDHGTGLVSIVWNCKNNNLDEDGNIPPFQYKNFICYERKGSVDLELEEYSIPTKVLTVPHTVEYNGTNYPVKHFDGVAHNQTIQILELPNQPIRTGSVFECNQLTTIKNLDCQIEVGFYSHCPNLKEVHLDKAESIDSFSNCEHLTTVVLGRNIREIGDYAFRNCTELSEIQYQGTMKEAVRCGIGNRSKKRWRADSNIERIVCSDGIITL